MRSHFEYWNEVDWEPMWFIYVFIVNLFFFLRRKIYYFINTHWFMHYHLIADQMDHLNLIIAVTNDRTWMWLRNNHITLYETCRIWKRLTNYSERMSNFSRFQFSERPILHVKWFGIIRAKWFTHFRDSGWR